MGFPNIIIQLMFKGIKYMIVIFLGEVFLKNWTLARRSDFSGFNIFELAILGSFCNLIPIVWLRSYDMWKSYETLNRVDLD